MRPFVKLKFEFGKNLVEYIWTIGLHPMNTKANQATHLSWIIWVPGPGRNTAQTAFFHKCLITTWIIIGDDVCPGWKNLIHHLLGCQAAIMRVRSHDQRVAGFQLLGPLK